MKLTILSLVGSLAIGAALAPRGYYECAILLSSEAIKLTRVLK